MLPVRDVEVSLSTPCLHPAIGQSSVRRYITCAVDSQYEIKPQLMGYYYFIFLFLLYFVS